MVIIDKSEIMAGIQWWKIKMDVRIADKPKERNLNGTNSTKHNNAACKMRYNCA